MLETRNNGAARRFAPQGRAGCVAEDISVKTTGDGPPLADADAPLGGAPADIDPSLSEPAPARPGKPRGGRPARGKKHRRHRRRPVYAPGTGPRAIEAPLRRAAERQVPFWGGSRRFRRQRVEPGSTGGSPATGGGPGLGGSGAAAPPLAVDARRGACPSTPRSTSAPTIAGCWSRCPRDHGFRVVDAFSRIVRLGEGIGADRPARRGGDGARHRGAQDLRRQARRAAGRAAPG